MVFKHKEQHFGDVESDHLAYKHWRLLENDGQLASFADLSPSMAGNLPTSDGSQEDVDKKDFEDETAIALNGDSLSARENMTAYSLEHGKRPLSDDEAHLSAIKRPKQAEHNLQLGLFEEFSICGVSPSAVCDVDLMNGESNAFPNDLGNWGNSNHWFTCDSGEEEGQVESPVQENVHPGYFEDYHHTAEFDHEEEICYSVFDYFPRKPVAIGPNHQAIIPEWRSNDFKNPIGVSDYCASGLIPASNLASSNHLVVDEDDSDKLVGTCVMPMHDSVALVSDVKVLHPKMDCSCPDEASIRCVRQHIMEAREKLRNVLGNNRFVELGFCNMGEVVAQKWTEEEENLFEEVVLSNPASLGKNFWNVLPHVFPSRSIKELVSYYFNVFILRKRAEQNRLDPLHVDSDNDEWQESDYGECMEEEDEEDSALESLAEQDDFPCQNEEETDVEEETDSEDECEEYAIAEGECGVSEAYLVDKSNFLPTVQLMEKHLHNCVYEQDIHDDSCTSYEAQHNGADSSLGGPVGIVYAQHGVNEGHENLQREYKNDGLSVMTDHMFFDGHCSLKAWDMSYAHGAEKVDFFSTCNVIEEVFGKEAWKNDNAPGFSQS